MADRVIKITSQQGFSEQWTVANTAGPQLLNLCDFTIPRGLNVDLSKSYVSFESAIVPGDAVPVNAAWYMDVDGTTQKYSVPTSALIRNASIRNDRGQIESVRRVDTLSCALWSLTNTQEAQQGDLNTFSIIEDQRGLNNYTSYNLNTVTNNTSNNGLNVQASIGKSVGINRDLKVPLKDIFGVGGAEKYSTSIFGETRIHLETNFNKLKSVVLGGSEGTSTMATNATFFGEMDGNAALAGGADFGKVIETSGTYGNWELTYPFFVGQAVVVKFKVDGVAATPVNAVIDSIRYQTNNTANPPTGLGKVFATLSVNLHNNGTATAQAITEVIVDAKIDGAVTNQITRAELVLYVIEDDGDMPQNLTFPTYTTEEDNGNNLVSFSKQYQLEAQADAVLIACCNLGAILPKKVVESYRYAIDQIEQTGNRDIRMSGQGNTAQATPLQFDRLQRCLEEQIGVGWRSGLMKFHEQLVAQGAAYTNPITMICETLEETPQPKMMNIEIECAALLQQLVIYKHMTKTV